MNMINTVIPLWTSQDAARVTSGTAALEWSATGISINTRTLKPGDLFIALVGPNVDGHDYIADAFEKGAVAACVSHRPPVLDPDAAVLVVDDTMKALEDLGAAARARTQASVIAVTGSVGKTGTKDALKSVLSAQAKTAASEGSLNNHWGLPLSLARTPADADFAVLEMGMNHPGELTALSQMARPHVCLITTIAPAHTEFFDSTDEIADAKAEIFKGAEPGAVAVLNADITEFGRLYDAARGAGMENIVTFGESINADFRVIAYALNPLGSTITARTPVGRIEYSIASPGKHWVVNSLGVLAAVHAAGGDVERAAQSLAKVTPPSGRGERFDVSIDGGSFTLIDESYNASPAAMRASLAVLHTQPINPGSRRIAVLGDMLELGADTSRLHAELADALVAHNIDTAFLAGEAMTDLWNALPTHMQGHHSVTSELLADVVTKAVRPGDVVMVKGSAGTRMSHIVNKLKANNKGKT